MILKIEGVSKNYVQGERLIEVLRGVDLLIDKPEILSIVGPSGSGKTTLLSLISGLDRPDQGGIWVLDTPLNSLSEDKLTQFRGRNLGIVFQQFHLIPHLTAEENISLPLEILGESEKSDRVSQALQSVGLTERKDHFPHQLSGGECQRVAIARAMVMEPRFILADEPSGNLDFKTSSLVMRVLFELVRAKGITMLLVTHNDELSKLCDRRLSMHEGRLC
ncbi:MAG: ABC transporter ATP-binding protein [Pseudomonadota bacterium]|nr:ABC transporter ATP-binding protein [Pseudomonadota bacterium]